MLCHRPSAAGLQVSSYEQHLSEAQAASFQALQDQLHSFQNDMAVAALLRTQLVDKDRQIDTIRLLARSWHCRPCVVLMQTCWLHVEEAASRATGYLLLISGAFCMYMSCLPLHDSVLWFNCGLC